MSYLCWMQWWMWLSWHQRRPMSSRVSRAARHVWRLTDRPAAERADRSPSNLSSMLIINPTYSALPVSLHRKLTFLFFSLPPPLLCLLLGFFFFSVPLPFAKNPVLCPFPPPPSRSKFVHVKIIDDEEYEKNKNFFLELAEPRMVDMSLQKGGVLNFFLSFSVSYSPTFTAVASICLISAPLLCFSAILLCF